jgi:hypothetical protein
MFWEQFLKVDKKHMSRILCFGKIRTWDEDNDTSTKAVKCGDIAIYDVWISIDYAMGKEQWLNSDWRWLYVVVMEHNQGFSLHAITSRSTVSIKTT